MQYTCGMAVDLYENALPSFSLYPNPAKDVVRIQSTVLKPNTAYTIRNSVGETVLNGTMMNGQVNTSALSAGLYIVSVEGGVRWFVKE